MKNYKVTKGSKIFSVKDKYKDGVSIYCDPEKEKVFISTRDPDGCTAYGLSYRQVMRMLNSFANYGFYQD